MTGIELGNNNFLNQHTRVSEHSYVAKNETKMLSGFHISGSCIHGILINNDRIQ